MKNIILPFLFIFSFSITCVGQTKFFWSDNASGTISKSDLNGDNPQVFISGITGVKSVRTYYGAGQIFWVGDDNTKIFGADAQSGTGATQLLYDGQGVIRDFDIMLTEPGYFFITDSDDETIKRFDFGGNNVTVIATGTEPQGITTDTINHKVYWSDLEEHNIQSANFDGTGALPVIGGIDAYRVALDVCASKIYWTDQSLKRIFRCYTDGSCKEELVTTGNNPTAITLDLINNKILWLDDNGINRSDLDGSNPEVINSSAASANGITQNSTPNICDGSAPIEICAACPNPSNIDVDCDGLDDACDEQIGVIYVKQSATGNNNGSSWADAYPNLQDAIDHANACSFSTFQIWVAAGTYKPSKEPGGFALPNNRYNTFYINKDIQLYGGFNGTETTISQRNWNTNVTTLSGDLGTVGNNADNAYHIVWLFNRSNAMVLDGFTITGGRANGSSSSLYQLGGGIFNDGSGGGSGSNPVITNCKIQSNSAISGAGMWNHLKTSPVITNCIFSGNSASADGGAILFNSTSVSNNPMIINCTFSGNSAGYGGALYNTSSSGTINFTLTNCVFSGNSASQQGGAILNVSYVGIVVNYVLTNCTYSGNKAFDGSAIRSVGGAASISLKNCIVSGNGPGTVSIMGFGIVTATYSIIQGGFPGTGNLNVNPMFVNQPAFNAAPTTAGDFHLQACSPARDAGTSSGAPNHDLDGNPRPVNSGYDRGAYEYQGPPGLIICYRDKDDDDYGNPNDTKAVCWSCGNGYVSDNTDCNDDDEAFHPDATEVCDGADNNCSGQADEGLSGLTYVGDVNIKKQEDVDAWLSCFSIIDGNLTISGKDILGLINLGNITQVKGTVNISDNKLLPSLTGLGNLATVENKLKVKNNPQLSDCCAIHNLINGGVGNGTDISGNPSGCKSVSEINQTCDVNLISPPGSSTSLRSLAEGFHLYPNPATQTLYLDLHNFLGQEVSISIYNHLGQQVLHLPEQELYDPHVTIDLARLALPDGIYLLSLKTMEGQQAKQFVIAR